VPFFLIVSVALLTVGIVGLFKRSLYEPDVATVAKSAEFALLARREEMSFLTVVQPDTVPVPSLLAETLPSVEEPRIIPGVELVNLSRVMLAVAEYQRAELVY
jgi:hypothetical protein